MAEVKWIKVATNMFETNRKIKQIEVMTKGDTIIVIWLKLLLLAGTINDKGAIYLTPEKPYNDKELANELRKPLKVVQAAMQIFLEYGMIEKVDGIIYLTSWEKHQNIDGMEKIRQQTRERVAKHRKAKTKSNGECNVTVTECNDIEEEGEEEKELDIHSFNHSIYSENFSSSKSNGECNAKNAELKAKAKMEYMGGSLGRGVVMLSDDQREHLFDILSYDEIQKYFGIVADCELNGKSYKKKTHYQAILDMVKKDRGVKNANEL